MEPRLPYTPSGTFPLPEGSALHTLGTHIRVSQREQLILHFINGLILAIPGGYISVGSFNTHSYSIKVRI